MKRPVYTYIYTYIYYIYITKFVSKSVFKFFLNPQYSRKPMNTCRVQPER